MWKSETEPRGLVHAFRAMVIACAGLNFGLFAWGYIESGFVSSEVALVFAATGLDAIVSLPSAIWWILLVLYTAACSGMYSFWKVSRSLFATLCICLAMLTLLSGLGVVTAVSGFLGTVWGTLQGAVLALAYSPPLAAKFH